MSNKKILHFVSVKKIFKNLRNSQNVWYTSTRNNLFNRTWPWFIWTQNYMQKCTYISCRCQYYIFCHLSRFSAQHSQQSLQNPNVSKETISVFFPCETQENRGYNIDNFFWEKKITIHPATALLMRKIL